MPQPVQVLLVEDSEDDAMLLAHRLAPHDEPVGMTRVDTAFALQAALNAQDWDMVISDYRMPLLTGLTALELVRLHNRDVPFILVSATIGEDVAVDAMRNGASDYVMKDKLGRLLPAFQRELRASRAKRDGAAERDAQRLRIERLIHFDPVTGLANGALLATRLARLVEEARATRRKVAVVVVELQRYPAITGIMGRLAGDALVEQAAARLSGVVDEACILARIGTGRFAIVLPGITDEARAVVLQRAIKAAFSAPFHVGILEHRLDPVAGIAVWPNHAGTAEQLLVCAETAAAQAGESGEPYLFYTEQITRRASERLVMENRLRRALERDEFVLHYQPKMNLRDGTVTSVEALLRWVSPDLGMVYPAQFVPMLEETGFIVEVGAWALRRAVADHERWSRMVPKAPRIAVNVSVSQLHHAGFLTVVKDAIGAGPRAPAIDLEITESLLMENVEECIAKLTAIRDLGIGVSIDDFGTGYSSLAYLAKLPVGAVKIDRVFVAGMLENAGSMRLVATMIELAHSLQLGAVAEGVESREQAVALRALGCDEIQGYLVGRPVSWEDMAALLASGGPSPALPPEPEPRA